MLRNNFLIALLSLFITCCHSNSDLDIIDYYYRNDKSDTPTPELQNAIIRLCEDNKDDAIYPIFNLLLSKKYNNTISEALLMDTVSGVAEINPEKSILYLMKLAEDSDNVFSYHAITELMDEKYIDASPHLERLLEIEKNPERRIFIEIALIYLNKDNNVDKIKEYYYLEDGKYKNLILPLITEENHKEYYTELSLCLYNNDIGSKQDCVIQIIELIDPGYKRKIKDTTFIRDIKLIKILEDKLLQNDPDVTFLILNHAPKYEILFKHCNEFIDDEYIETRKAAQKCINRLRSKDK